MNVFSRNVYLICSDFMGLVSVDKKSREFSLLTKKKHVPINSYKKNYSNFIKNNLYISKK